MSMKKTNPDFLNGVPELLILQLLGRQPMHGYALVQTMRVASSERLDFGEGCIYPILHRLEEEGFLKSERTLVRGRDRITYQVTAAGKKRLATSRDAWQEITAAIAAILNGGSDAAPNLA
jgi:PadR family transcriptional regulator PadR